MVKTFKLTKDNVRLGTNYTHMSDYKAHRYSFIPETIVRSSDGAYKVMYDMDRNVYHLNIANSIVCYTAVLNFMRDLKEWLNE